MNARQFKNILIYPKFQLTLIGINIIVNSAAFILIYFSVNDVFDKLKNMGMKINLAVDHPYYIFLKHSQEMMDIKLYWAFATSIIFSSIISMIISHKMVGPIYRLRKFFREIDNTEAIPNLDFRKNDYLI